MCSVCVYIFVLFIYIHTVECYSALKTNEILPFVTTWTDLEGIMLSEVSHRTPMWNSRTETNEQRKDKRAVHYREQRGGGERGGGAGNRDGGGERT